MSPRAIAGSGDRAHLGVRRESGELGCLLAAAQINRGGLCSGDFKRSGVFGFAMSALSLKGLRWSLMRGSVAAIVWALSSRCSQHGAVSCGQL